MRPKLAQLLVAPLATLAASDNLAPFQPAIGQIAQQADAFGVFKRQNTACATGYYACTNENAAGLCCPRTAVCTADQNRNVACCPQGSTCTGALGNAQGPVPSPTPTFVFASTTAPGAIVQQTIPPSVVAASTVANQYYPFPYIPTTYTNAAACSAAYSSCQTNAASCSTALANGAQGVTIIAPNGGATITAVPSVGLTSAQSICASLSLQACSGLQVEACRSFGGVGNMATMVNCGGYLMAGGVAVGLAGQMLR